MCGIYGELNLHGGTVDASLVRAMGAMIVHRGPDDDGLYTDREVAIGLRRLSIIDLEGGQQPLFNEDRSIAVVCNGEIYNFRELRERLKSLGHSFRTGSDAEVIVHCYEEYGDAFPAELEGMFGFALWDSQRRRLILGRDRLGIKPVYYTQSNRRIAFCSESKALVSRADLTPELDPAALEEFLTLGYVPQPHSLFTGIRKLPPGHVAIVEDGQCHEQPYWELAFDTCDDLSEQDWIERIDSTLAASIEAQMVSDVPIGAFLSGGIDSSLIIAYMNRISDQPVSTYSIGYAGSSGAELYNELPYARQIADEFKTDHHEIMVEPNVVSLLPGLVWHMDEPTVDSALITSYLVSEFAARHVKVILSGVGGDELFGGYNRYLMGHYVGLMQKVPSALRRGVLLPLINRLPEDRHSKLLNLFRYLRSIALLSNAGDSERYRQLMEVFPRADLDRLLSAGSDDSDDALTRVLQKYADSPELDRILAADLSTQLVDELLLLTDKMSMSESLECRVPLLDERLIELARTMPANLRVRGGQTRYILKKALRGVLPDDIIDRKKRGFGAPLGAWLRHELEPVTELLLGRRQVEKRGLLNPEAVEDILRSHRERRSDQTDQLMALITLELWCQLFLDGHSVSDLTERLTAASQPA